jgi:hypothetical protein
MAPAPGVAEAMAADWLGAAYGPQAAGRSLPILRVVGARELHTQPSC